MAKRCAWRRRTFEIGTPAREATRAWDIMPHVELPGGKASILTAVIIITIIMYEE